VVDLCLRALNEDKKWLACVPQWRIPHRVALVISQGLWAHHHAVMWWGWTVPLVVTVSMRILKAVFERFQVLFDVNDPHTRLHPPGIVGHETFRSAS
jgi:hypothetical protein